MQHQSQLFGVIVTLGLLVASTGPVQAQQVRGEVKEQAKELAVSFVGNMLPAELELYYLDNADNSGQSMAIRYDWSTNHGWTDDFGDSGMDFSGSKSDFFARGNYVFKDDVNPSELSEVGGSWTRRWFPINVANPLDSQQGQQVQACQQGDPTFTLTVEDCRERLGFGRTQLSYWYVDVDVHAKVEGDQSFDQRNYVFGVETNLSRNFGSQKLILNPVLTLGIEQVDPKRNEARAAVMATDDVYTRAYGEFGFTGSVARIRGEDIKLNFSVRHFRELGPEDVISDAGLDTFTYSVVALQIPAVLIPGFDNPRNSFVLSYADGELPFNVSSETTFELGFRHDVDFGAFF